MCSSLSLFAFFNETNWQIQWIIELNNSHLYFNTFSTINDCSIYKMRFENPIEFDFPVGCSFFSIVCSIITIIYLAIREMKFKKKKLCGVRACHHLWPCWTWTFPNKAHAPKIKSNKSTFNWKWDMSHAHLALRFWFVLQFIYLILFLSSFYFISMKILSICQL